MTLDRKNEHSQKWLADIEHGKLLAAGLRVVHCRGDRPRGGKSCVSRRRRKGFGADVDFEVERVDALPCVCGRVRRRRWRRWFGWDGRRRPEEEPGLPSREAVL